MIIENIILYSCLGLLFIASFSLWYAITERRANNTLLDQLHQAERQLKILQAGSIGMGHRVLALEQKMQSIEKKQNDISQSDLDFSLTQAQRLIEQGLNSDTVAANSGLSMSEVNLMEMLYRQSNHREVSLHE